MHPRPAHPFTKAPAVRLLLPFITGILVQWYLPLPLPVLLAGGTFLLIAILLYQALPLTLKYQLAPVYGVLLSLLISLIGAGAVYNSDIRNRDDWFGHYPPGSKALLL